MKVAPSARIPANTAAACFFLSMQPIRPHQRGSWYRAFVRVLFIMKNFSTTLRLSALACACACACAVNAQTTPQLKEVVITGRLQSAAESQPMGISVITQEDIRRAGATTVNDALIRVLGVVGRQDFYGGGDYGLDLRGFGTTSASNQAIIVDGIKINEADLGGSRLAGIPIESVERIEVLRGSGAVLYGESATGGVIIITTKAGTGAARKTGGSLYAGVGSYGLRELRANGTYGNAGFSMDVNAQKRNADNHRDNFKSQIDGVALTGQWSGDWLRVGGRLGRDSLETRLPGALTAGQYSANPKQTNNPDDAASIDNNSSGLFAEALLADWRLTADFGLRDKALRSVNSGFKFDYDVSAKTYALRAAHSATLTGFSNRVVFGLDDAKWERDVLGAFGSKASQTSRALYARDEVTITATGTDVSAGLRTETLKKQDSSGPTILEGRQNAWEIGVRQPLSKEFSLYARAGKSFRLANVDEIGFTAPGVDLLPQTSKDVELGLRYSAELYKVDARWYRSALKNEIGFDPNANGPFGPGSGANVNFDPTLRTGLEASASVDATKALRLSANAAFRRAKFSSGVYSGNDVALAAHRTLSLRADWTPVANHHVSGGVNFVSAQRADFANECSIPAYHTADVRYAFDWQSVELALGVTNLFDRKYYTQAFTCISNVTNSIYPEAGRALTASMRVKF
jgi:iron complex outermembrane recepter protein